MGYSLQINKCKSIFSQDDMLKYSVSHIFKNQPQKVVLLTREIDELNYKLVHV